MTTHTFVGGVVENGTKLFLLVYEPAARRGRRSEEIRRTRNLLLLLFLLLPLFLFRRRI